MTPTPVLFLLAVALVGCASASTKRLPVCDGQHRRPANPYGSVLDPKPAAAAPAAAPPASQPPPAAPPSGCGA